MSDARTIYVTAIGDTAEEALQKAHASARLFMAPDRPATPLMSGRLKVIRSAEGKRIVSARVRLIQEEE